MPVVTVPNGDGNHRIDTLLSTKAPITGWVKGLVIQNLSETATLLIGSSAMGAADYDAAIGPGDSYEDSGSEGAVMLATRYLRNDHASDDADAAIRFDMT